MESRSDLNLRQTTSSTSDVIPKPQLARTVQLATSKPQAAAAAPHSVPTISPGLTPAQYKQNEAKAAELATAKETLENHENLGSPYTQNTVMVGAAYGAVGVATGEVVGKAFTGFSDYIKANKAIKVFRAYGGDAKAAGFSWTTENPVNIPDFRNAAGLP